MSDPILITRDGAIATVTLNNPERLNALNRAMWAQLGEVMREPDVRARLEQVGTQLRETRPEEFEAFMRAEVAKYEKLVKDANVRVE